MTGSREPAVETLRTVKNWWEGFQCVEMARAKMALLVRVVEATVIATGGNVSKAPVVARDGLMADGSLGETIFVKRVILAPAVEATETVMVVSVWMESVDVKNARTVGSKRGEKILLAPTLVKKGITEIYAESMMIVSNQPTDSPNVVNKDQKN